ncbi:MAG: hypothetical protein IKC11_02980 [Clostridia bacterium]|nr:hypothetical protein [Clostridia bacterium]
MTNEIELPTMEDVKRAVEQSRKARKKRALRLAREKLAEYYKDSVSGCVLEDYRKGNVKIIHCK